MGVPQYPTSFNRLRPGRPAMSPEAVGSAAKEFEKAEVAEDLELLADFVANVSVFGVELCEGGVVRVYVGEGEIHLP